MGTPAALPLVAAVLSGWVAQPPTKVARTEVGAARLGAAAYLVGGFSPRGNATLATVERYDLRRGTTRIVAPMPIALNHAPAVAHGGGVYVVGGYAGSGHGADAGTRGLLRYDPRSDRWSRLAPMPTARGALCAGAIGGRIYAAGGASRGHPLDTLEVYDIAGKRWTTGPPMGRGREHLACAVAAGKLYVLAGRASGQGNFTTAERFDPATNRWESLPDMAKARGGIAAATVGDDVVVLGGEESAGTIEEVEAYNVATRGWRALPDLRTPRHGLGAVAYRGRVYAIEGGTSPGFSFSRTVEALVARRASSS
jgi:N-acetylneuraminic acid mutarotase